MAVGRIGNLSGRLKTEGRFLGYPFYLKPGNRTMSNFYVTLLNACGMKCGSFGLADPMMKDFEQNGPLSELL